MKSLFIGGPMDGQRIETEGKEHVFVPLRMGDDEFRQVMYRKEIIVGGDKGYCVYLADDDEPRDVIARLIAGYAGKASGGPSRKPWPPKLETRG